MMKFYRGFLCLFRRKPRCPACDAKGHDGPEWHEHRFEELLSEVKHLRDRTERSRQAADNRFETALLLRMLDAAIDDLLEEAFFVGRSGEVPNLLLSP